MKENPETKTGERLQVALARHGIASRRGVVTLIEEGQVKVNGEVVKEKGFRVVPTDKIEINGRELAGKSEERKRYFVLNKPKGVMTTLQDPNAEETVADFFRDVPERIFPVGRLDRDTTGLLLMTNDGELAFRLTHPKFGVEKRYRAVVKGVVIPDTIKKLEQGIELEEGKTAPCKIEITDRSARETALFVTLHEGKKRQIRRIFQKMGHFVKDLQRLSYGPLSLGHMRAGETRELSKKEVDALKAATGLKNAR